MAVRYTHCICNIRFFEEIEKVTNSGKKTNAKVSAGFYNVYSRMTPYEQRQNQSKCKSRVNYPTSAKDGQIWGTTRINYPARLKEG